MIVPKEEFTEEEKLIIKSKGIKYKSEEYHKAMGNAESAFNKKFCKNDMDISKTSCLDFQMSDADYIDVPVEKGMKRREEIGVRLFCLGECEVGKEDFGIGIVSDGKKAGWIKDGEDYKRGLEEDRIFYEEDF